MGIPKELIALDCWVNYRCELDEKTNKNKKIPVDPHTGKSAKSNDSTTWGSYDMVLEAKNQFGASGIGFMFDKANGYVGIDIDDCYDPDKGEFNEVAKAILEHTPTYAEFSPSGRGVHLYFKGTKPNGASKNTENGVEMYDNLRYFTVTGNMVPNATETITVDKNGTLEWIFKTFLRKQKTKKKKMSTALSDEEILDLASTAANGETFTLLWSGKWEDKYPSQSEADMALCMKLAFWSNKNAEQIDRMFRNSGLMRPKWNERHYSGGETYGEETVKKAIENTTVCYNKNSDAPIVEYEGHYLRIRGDNVYSLTNFLLEPVEMISSEDETQLTADFVTINDKKFRISLMTGDFANQQKFKNLLNRKTISLAYYGNDGDLELLKSHISELAWPTKEGVKALGIHEHKGKNVFVSCDGAFEAGCTSVEDIVQIEKYRSIATTITETDIITKEELLKTLPSLFKYNEPEKAVPIIAWVAACFVKSMLNKENIKFPHLMLIGEAGSGKSTTLEVIILPIFSMNRVIAATQVTPFTLMKEAASSNLVPLALDEFKPSKIDKLKINALYNHFRDAYDGHDGLRGRADQSMVSYKLLAPLVLAGEESPEEAAIRERSIELLFSKKDIKNPSYRKEFKALSKSRIALEDFGRTLLDTALTLDSTEVKAWHEEGIQHFKSDFPARVVNNLACCYTGLKLIEKLGKRYDLNWDDLVPFSFDTCIRNLEVAAQEYLLDGGTHNQSIVEQTFEIMSRMQLDPKNDFTLADNNTVLYLRLSQVYDKYTKYRKDYAIVGEVLTYAQFMKQLSHSDLFLGNNIQKKIHGMNAKCWAVDFEKLKQRCDVSGFEVTDIPPI